MNKRLAPITATLVLCAACSGRLMFQRGERALQHHKPSKLQRFIKRHGDKQPFADMAMDHIAWYRAETDLDSKGLPKLDRIQRYLDDYPNGMHADSAHHAKDVAAIANESAPPRARLAMLKALYVQNPDNPYLTPHVRRFLDGVAFISGDVVILENSFLESQGGLTQALLTGKISGVFADAAGAVERGDIVRVCGVSKGEQDVTVLTRAVLGEVFVMTMEYFDEEKFVSLVRGGTATCGVGWYTNGEASGWTTSNNLSQTMPGRLPASYTPSTVVARRLKVVGGDSEVVEENNMADPWTYTGGAFDVGPKFWSLTKARKGAS